MFKLYGHYCYLCGDHARAVDHIVAGDNHDISNLAPICDACHAQKTNQERHTHG